VSHLGEDLTALLDGALPPARRAEAEAHLAGCDACRAERDRLAAALARLGALPPPAEPSPWFATRLEARLAELEATLPAGTPAMGRTGLMARLSAWRWRLALPVAALGAAAGLALFTVRHQRAARAEELAVAAQLDLLLDLETVRAGGDLADAEEVAVVAALDELSPVEGRP